MNEDKIEMAARVIDPVSWRIRDLGPFPPDHQASTSIVKRSVETAQRLADTGLLGPTPEETSNYEGSRFFMGDVTRIEVIDADGSAYSSWDVAGVEVHLQDGGATLKLFHSGKRAGADSAREISKDEIAEALATANGWPGRGDKFSVISDELLDSVLFLLNHRM